MRNIDLCWWVWKWGISRQPTINGTYLRVFAICRLLQNFQRISAKIVKTLPNSAFTTVQAMFADVHDSISSQSGNVLSLLIHERQKNSQQTAFTTSWNLEKEVRWRKNSNEKQKKDKTYVGGVQKQDHLHYQLFKLKPDVAMLACCSECCQTSATKPTS